MIKWHGQFGVKNELGALTCELRVRVLNGSATGCLVESSRPLTVGTVAALRVNLLGREYDDQVQVTRCQSIVGAGNIFHIAMNNLFERIVREEQGQDLIEYALLAGLISIASILAITTLGTSIQGKFTDVGTGVTNAGS